MMVFIGNRTIVRLNHLKALRIIRVFFFIDLSSPYFYQNIIDGLLIFMFRFYWPSRFTRHVDIVYHDKIIRHVDMLVLIAHGLKPFE